MADSTAPILLNKGLDTVTPAPLVEPGALIDCLNYEMISDVGYRRIDGFERYDGWINGELADYYRVNLTITDNGVIPSLTAGNTITGTGTDLLVYGVVISYSGGVLVYAPANKDLPIIPQGTSLAIHQYSAGVQAMTTSSTATKGSVTDDLDTFVANVRTYSTTLRNMVQDVPTPVAGLHWFRNNLVVAHDCYTLDASVAENGTATLDVGALVDYNGIRYRVISFSRNSGVVPPSLSEIHLQKLGTGTAATFLSQINRDTQAVQQVTTTSQPNVLSVSSLYATLSYCRNPTTDNTRELVPLEGTFWCAFTGGQQISGSDPVEDDVVYIDTGANSARFRIVSIQVNSGAFSTNNAAGYIELQSETTSSFPIKYPKPSDVVYSENTLTTTFATLGAVNMSTLAGTEALRITNTRYQGLTYNFYGNQALTEGYIVTGASNGAHVRIAQTVKVFSTQSVADDSIPVPSGGFYDTNFWGSLWTQANNNPKYVAVHKGNRLALGTASGSVIMSAVGEPRNYSGFEGAVEIAVGDAVTGLLEAQGDSLIVFGQRGIRRITGTVDSEMNLDTISGNSGCYDYTAVLVGATPTFTGPSGISTLEQTASYGDFAGARVSYKINNTLLHEIVPDRVSSELGGVAMALPVRSKNQYRLWLGIGKVICATFAADGPRLTYINYGQTGDNRVPLAWTSELSDFGQEMIFVVWDKVRAERYLSATGEASTTPEEDRIYQLDRGWGFDGSTFEFYFDTAHVFPSQGNMATGIEKVRLYGLSHGIATLNVKTSGIEDTFDQDYHETVQDLSLPADPDQYYPNMFPMTSIIDQANWGLGIKIRICNTTAAGLTTVEPPHICQVMNLFVRTQGALDA